MLVNMNSVLYPAQKNGYGVGFFNAVNVEMARAVIETAEVLRSPVMIGTAVSLMTISVWPSKRESAKSISSRTSTKPAGRESRKALPL